MDKEIKDLRDLLVIEIYPEYHLIEISHSINNILEETEDEEMQGFLEDLSKFFYELGSDTQKVNWQKIIFNHICTINWENYRNEDNTFFKLGEVWYNRLQWMEESDEDQLITFAKKVLPVLPQLMNKFEEYHDTNN